MEISRRQNISGPQQQDNIYYIRNFAETIEFFAIFFSPNFVTAVHQSMDSDPHGGFRPDPVGSTTLVGRKSHLVHSIFTLGCTYWEICALCTGTMHCSGSVKFVIFYSYYLQNIMLKNWKLQVFHTLFSFLWSPIAFICLSDNFL